MSQVLRFALWALGRPYHAARVSFAARTPVSELHAHADFYELMGVVSGRGEHLLPTGSQPLEAGDVVLVRPRDQHAFKGTAPDRLEFINVAFPSSAWQGFLTLTRTDAAGTWDASRTPITFRPDDPAAAIEVFEHALRPYQDKPSQDKPSQDEPSQFDLVRFWIDLLPLVSPDEVPARPAGTVGTKAPAWLAEACAAMRAEENLRGGVPRLLELAGVSPAHLSRTVRAAYGLTPTDLVTDLRLERAASLLAATTDPIAGIATRCGFTSQSYFTRRFTTAHQVSPRTFRQQSQRAFVP